MRSLILLLIIPVMALVSTPAYGNCWYVVEDEAKALGVEVNINSFGNCAMRWNKRRYHTFQIQLHVYGVHQEDVYYVGSLEDGRQVFGHGLDTTQPFGSIWYDPIVVDGKIFFAATDGYVKGKYSNTVVYGDQSYSYGLLGGIPAGGPVIWRGEPVIISQLENGSWTVFVGETPDHQSFAFVPRWRTNQPSIWGEKVKDGQLIYTAIDETGLVENHVWGEGD